jgi:hypothetical protein
MHDRLRLVSAATLVTGLGFAAGCSTPSLTLFPRVASLESGGDFAAVDTSGGATLSATSDADSLGLDSTETTFAPRVDLDWSRWHLTIDSIDLSRDGTGVTEAEIEFDGVTIPAGDDVDTNLDLQLSSATLCFDFLPAPNAELGLGLGVVYADMAADITSLTLGDTASADEEVPLPVLAARAGISFGRFSLGALARGLDVEIDDVDATYIDLDAHARYDLFQATDSHFRGGLMIGWRHIGFDARFDDDDSTIDTELEYSGPYAGIAITF